jgi:diguanylate cyclase (GGDEF)-like protein
MIRLDTMPAATPETAGFITELDAAIEAHMAWVRHVLRYVLLGETPGADVLDPAAETLCQFSGWFGLNRGHFERMNQQKTRRLEEVHKTMHDAMRTICTAMLGGQAAGSADLERYEQAQHELLGLLAQFKTLFLLNAAQADPLTGLRLRAGIENEYLQAQKVCRRNQMQLYVGMIDADHFKRINDRHGHLVGDRALRHLADTLRHIVRPNEPLIRWGGEEFLLLIQCRNAEEAAGAAQRIVHAVHDTPMPLEAGGQLALSVTMGLARAGSEEPMASAFERADQALYAGKSAGRNRYVIAEDAAAC